MEGHFLPFLLELVIVFILGAAGGSFANVVALSYPDFRKILIGRSACPKCHHRLSWYELIPLVSYIWQTGKCRSCRQPIAISYLTVEVLTGLLFVGVYLATFGQLWWWQSLLLLLILLGWVIIFLHDWRTMYVPMGPFWLVFLLTVGWQASLGNLLLVNALLSAVGAFVFIFLLRLVASFALKQEAMGSADAYVAALVGVLMGAPAVYVAIFSSFLIGSVYGLILVYVEKRKSLKTKVAFAPALLLGGLVGLLWGERLVNWYLGNL